MQKPRILVLDDEALIGYLLEDYLSELDCETVGPVATVSDALQKMEAEPIAGAILDVSLRGNTNSYPLAEVLLKNGTPFAFSTGHCSTSIAPQFSDVRKLSKPFVFDDVRKLIESWQIAPSL